MTEKSVWDIIYKGLSLITLPHWKVPYHLETKGPIIMPLKGSFKRFKVFLSLPTSYLTTFIVDKPRTKM